jgi:hypothetical protein
MQISTFQTYNPSFTLMRELIFLGYLLKPRTFTILSSAEKHKTMQLFGNNGLPAIALALVLVLLSSFADTQSQNPIPYLSAPPDLAINYSWDVGCTPDCLSADLAAGGCCMSAFLSQYAVSSL